MNKEDKALLARYEFHFQIKEKATGHADVIDIDGAKNLHNIFLPDTVKAIIDGIRAGEKDFADKLARGELVQAKDGQYDFAGFPEPPKTPEELIADKKNEMKKDNGSLDVSVVEHVKSREDLQGGIIEDE